MIEIQSIKAHLDFLLVDSSKTPVVLSFFDRSQQVVKSMGATLNSNNKGLYIRKETVPYKNFYIFKNKGYDIYISPIVYGKEKFYHGLAISKDLNQNFILSIREKLAEHFYDFLMKNYDLPLLKEWSMPILEYGLEQEHISQMESPLILGQYSISESIPIGKEKFTLQDIQVVSCMMTENELEEDVSSLLKEKRIQISKQEQSPLQFSNMDSYFKLYGHTLVENLEKQLNPLTELNGTINTMCLKHMRLFPQQAAQVNAIVKHLQRSSFCILNNGMGCGKTLQSISIVEAYFVEKWLRTHPKDSLQDVYRNSENINYRVIIMCPGHLVEKWESEISREIPFAKVSILKEVSQLVKLKEKGKKREGKEFFIVSKDFAKLSYQLKPLPRKRRIGWLQQKYCCDCGKAIWSTENKCNCGSTNIRLENSSVREFGMVCPSCNQIVVPYKTNLFQENQKTLDVTDFATNTTTNDKCYYCGESLWGPHVPNIGENKQNVWFRATHYANKAHKGKKTVWVHRAYAKEYFDFVKEKPLHTIDTETHFGIRKISPAYYIKKQLQGFFDFAIFDEAHLCKGAGTAQGNAMHALVKASKKQLALTGTIAGGYASHLFYLLYRLNPRRMQTKGYAWTDVMKFVDKYGQKETWFACSEEEGTYNTNSRGRQVASPKEKPGISPLIFTDFLLDSAVFLDLSDMSKYLPPLKEYVELVTLSKTIEDSNGNVIDNLELTVLQHYNEVLNVLKKATREKGGKAVLSSLLQFALSYLDYPYGAETIKHSISGHTIVKPNHFDIFQQEDILLAKEQRLIELIKKEQTENRNCFVFAEYTGNPSTCVTYRLKAIIEKHCNLKGKVVILESSSPSADKREEWIHKKAEEGIKVFITNPRNTETGLDFCFKKNGVLYNYPTIIFYQMGYSLFTIWQASRRHYRLNQREECRTYYMAISGTIQQTILSLIAQKMAATSAIQGKFSVEGLSSMAQGIDVKLKLAQALSHMDEQSGADLQGMFDVLQADNIEDGAYGTYHKMLTLEELIGKEEMLEVMEEKKEAILDDIIDIFDMFDKLETISNDETLISSAIPITVPMEMMIPTEVSLPKKAWKKVPVGQVSLFGF